MHPTGRLTAATLLGVVAATLSVLGPATPAEAKPVPCVRNFAGDAKALPAGSSTASSLDVPAGSGVEDVDVTVRIDHRNAANLAVRLTHSSRGAVLQARLPGNRAQPGRLIWDDEAPEAYSASSGAGTFRPAEPLAVLDATAAAGEWRLVVDNDGVAGDLVAWSVRISYTSCDADVDGVEDHVDNCIGLANPDQADFDGDRVGDACDGDPDGDGVVGAADNCPQVADATLLDTDRDGLGDACDADDDSDGTADSGDGCPTVAASTVSGCPSAATSLRAWIKKVRTRKSKDVRFVLKGQVRSVTDTCLRGGELELWRKRDGRDTRLVVFKTQYRGTFHTRAPRMPGRYYVTLSRTYATGVAECAASTSKTLRVRSG